MVAFVEQDEYCQKVLKKHWADVPIINDIRDYRHGDVSNTESEGARRISVKDEAQRPQSSNELFGERSTVLRNSKGDRTYDRPAIDLLTGGFPCQPFSVAGKQRGKADDRYLWPEMLRVIQEAKPRWIIGENVPGIINMGLETTVLDLEGEGYEVELLVLSACGIGSWHKRDRVWIVANLPDPNSEGSQRYRRECQLREDSKETSPCRGSADVYDTAGIRIQSELHKTKREEGQPGMVNNTNSFSTDREQPTNRSVKPKLGDMADGLSAQLGKLGVMWDSEPDIPRVAIGIKDRVKKLKALGNAIVPQCVMPIMWAIREIDDYEKNRRGNTRRKID